MRILVVDDHKLILEGIGMLLRNQLQGADVLTADCAEYALDVVSKEKDLNLVILDLYLPGLDGHAFLKAMRARKNCVPVIVISSSENINDIKDALDVGAKAFLPKSATKEEMVDTIYRVLDGEKVVPKYIRDQITRLQMTIPAQTGNTFPLTRRQREVVTLIEKGLSNKQISKTLNISESTTKSHVSALFDLLNASNRTECLRRAKELGILP